MNRRWRITVGSILLALTAAWWLASPSPPEPEAPTAPPKDVRQVGKHRADHAEDRPQTDSTSPWWEPIRHAEPIDDTDYVAQYHEEFGPPGFVCRLDHFQPQYTLGIHSEKGFQALTDGMRLFGWPKTPDGQGIVHIEGYAPTRLSWVAGADGEPGRCLPDPLVLGPPDTTAVITVRADASVLDPHPLDSSELYEVSVTGCFQSSSFVVSQQDLVDGETQAVVEIGVEPCTIRVDAQPVHCVGMGRAVVASATVTIQPVQEGEVQESVSLAPVTGEQWAEMLVTLPRLMTKPPQSEAVEFAVWTGERLQYFDVEQLEDWMLDAGLPQDTTVELRADRVSISVPSYGLDQVVVHDREGRFVQRALAYYCAIL